MTEYALGMDNDFKAAVARAKQRTESEAILVNQILAGETFGFHFLPEFSGSALEMVEKFEKLREDDVTEGETLILMSQLLDVMVTTETRERISVLVEERIMSLKQLMELTVSGVEAVTGRPFGTSLSSPTDSSETGVPSMASAPTGPSTQPPWPSLDS